MTPDVTQWLKQSSIEATRSLRETDPERVAEHQERCLLFTGRALAALIEQRVAFPFSRAA